MKIFFVLLITLEFFFLANNIIYFEVLLDVRALIKAFIIRTVETKIKILFS